MVDLRDLAFALAVHFVEDGGDPKGIAYYYWPEGLAAVGRKAITP